MNKHGCCCCHYCSCCFWHGPGPFFGRLLIGLMFLFGGIGKFVDYFGAVESLRQLSIVGPEATFYIGIGALMEIVGALMIILGWHTRVGAWILMVFLFPTTIIYHGFWAFEGVAAQIQFVQFMKNLTIYGGLLLLVSYGPGRWSMDAARIRRYYKAHPHDFPHDYPYNKFHDTDTHHSP